jgi:hypothetical protein
MSEHAFYDVAIGDAFLKSGMHESCIDHRGGTF